MKVRAKFMRERERERDRERGKKMSGGAGQNIDTEVGEK